jgi:trehalose 6-phosphate synthase/phosphatase
VFSKRPGIKPKLDALRTLYEGKKIIVGRDKLDVVKGVLQKVCFFSFRGPIFKKKKNSTIGLLVTRIRKITSGLSRMDWNVVMIQVTSPALTDSPKLERMVSEIVAHINGEYGSLDFVPVHH